MKVIEKEIGQGDSAVRITVGDMCRLAKRDSRHPAVVALAKTLKSGRSEEEAIRAAFYHVVKVIPYRSDPAGIEEVTAPIYSLRLVPVSGEVKQYWRVGGDCDDQSAALVALLVAMGVRCTFRVIAWRVYDYTHVYVVAYLKSGRRLPLDPVMGRSGFGNEKKDVIRAKEFECMIQRTLEDNLQTMQGGGQRKGGCGCGCGGRGGKKKGGCCPQNYEQSPINVIVNTGSVNANQNNRLSLLQRAFGAAGRMGRTVKEREVVREKPIIQRRNMYYQRTISPRVQMPDVLLPRPVFNVSQAYDYPPAVERKKLPRWPEWP